MLSLSKSHPTLAHQMRKSPHGHRKHQAIRLHFHRLNEFLGEAHETLFEIKNIGEGGFLNPLRVEAGEGKKPWMENCGILWWTDSGLFKSEAYNPAGAEHSRLLVCLRYRRRTVGFRPEEGSRIGQSSGKRHGRPRQGPGDRRVSQQVGDPANC